ncbi:conserved hypothetical protein [Paraburkholderia tropica]
MPHEPRAEAETTRLGRDRDRIQPAAMSVVTRHRRADERAVCLAVAPDGHEEQLRLRAELVRDRAARIAMRTARIVVLGKRLAPEREHRFGVGFGEGADRDGHRMGSVLGCVCLQRVEDGAQHRHHLVDFLGRHVQRRHEAQQVRARRVQQQAVGLHVARLVDDRRADVLAEHQRAQQTFAALALEAAFRRQFEQLFAQIFAARAHAFEEARRDQLRDHRVAGGRHHRIAVVGAALIAGFEHADVLFREQRRERHAAADALAERHDVRLDVRQFIGEQRARAAAAGLHFIDDQQDAVLLRERAQLLHEFARSGDHAAFALDRLEHHGDRLRVDELLDRRDVVQIGLRETRHLRCVDRVPARLAARRHRRDRAAVEAVVERDDLERAVAMLFAPLARELDRAFVGFGAAVGEEHLVEAAMLGEQARETRHRLVVEGRRRIDEQARLLVHRFDHAVVAVAEAVDRPALNEVEIALAFVVVEPRPLAMRENDFGPVGDVHQRLDRVLGKIHGNGLRAGAAKRVENR